MADRIDSIIGSILNKAETEQSQLFAIQQRWGEIVGKEQAEYSRPVKLARGRLTVFVRHPADGFTIAYRRVPLLRQIQAQHGNHVTELVIRTGQV